MNYALNVSMNETDRCFQLESRIFPKTLLHKKPYNYNRIM